MVSGTSWTVRAQNGEEYTALGYEERGLWSVPVAEFVNGECISTTVFEICNGMVYEGSYISVTRPNATELAMLEDAGWEYNGAFAHKKEV